MMQIDHVLPADVPACAAGHRPVLVETRGAPHGHPIGTPAPTTWHIECARCRVATAPTQSRAMAETRWRFSKPQQLITTSDLSRYRAALAAHRAA